MALRISYVTIVRTTRLKHSGYVSAGINARHEGLHGTWSAKDCDVPFPVSDKTTRTSLDWAGNLPSCVDSRGFCIHRIRRGVDHGEFSVRISEKTVNPSACVEK